MLEIRPLTPAIGALVTGLDLAGGVDALDEKTVATLREAWAAHKVLVLRGLELTPRGQLDVARVFGEVEPFPMGTSPEPDLPEVMLLATGAGRPGRADRWHSDATFLHRPPAGAMLRAVSLPPLGGDTLWADMEAAYSALSPALQALLEPLSAEHDAMKNPTHRNSKRLQAEKREPAVHPVVRTHPVTGRRSLFVNRTFTTRILGIDERESEQLLPYLADMAARPEFQCRLVWQQGDVALWDNRCTQHNAVHDYEAERVMHRIVLAGDEPR